jgi:excisionase family DNA binding protein
MGTARLLKASDVAERLQCSPFLVYELARDGRLPAVRIGRLVRFREEDIETLMKAARKEAS